MLRPLARLAALGLALLAPHASFAGALAPAKASDLVTLFTSTKTTCPGGGEQFDLRVLPDGTIAPFTIPAKQVLVVQSVDWTIGSSVPAGLTVSPTVTLQTGATAIPILIGSGTTNSDGGASGTVLAPPGITVRAGPSLCISGGDFTSAVLHGFLAKDK
jgi:hypothetical protein